MPLVSSLLKNSVLRGISCSYFVGNGSERRQREGCGVAGVRSQAAFRVPHCRFLTSSGGRLRLQPLQTVQVIYCGHKGEQPAHLLPTSQLHLLQRKRSTNASVRGAVFVLKSKNAGRRKDTGAAATDGSGSPAVGSGVCGQWHAAKRVLPQSRFGLEHAGSPSEEEKEEEQPGGWPGRGGIGHAEVAGRARAELWAGRGVSGRVPDRRGARFCSAHAGAPGERVGAGVS